MRNIQKLIVFTLLTFIFSCSDDVLKDVNSTEEKERSTLQKSNITQNSSQSNSQNNTLQYSQSKLIIQYNPGTTNAVKDSLRQRHGVVSFEICRHCPDESIEEWDFGGPINIEPKKGVIENPDDDEDEDEGLYPIKDVDYEFRFAVMNYSSSSINSTFETEYIPFIKGSNNGITIAVIDTGIDTSLAVFTEPFLYNASGTDLEIEGALSGWNFVNDSNDPYDDNSGKHGTAVSKIIEQELSSLSIDFQIMPIKAFDASGSASYFDVVCATNLALTYADVVNMSFGWYNSGYDLLNRFINEAQEEFVINASAGNNSINTDYNVHYPSTFDSENIISVAALNNEPINLELSWFSNFGTTTVDIAARGERIPFYLNMNEFITVQGTSFSCAYTSALGGKVFDSGMNVNQHISAILSNTIQHDNLSGIKYASYIPF